MELEELKKQRLEQLQRELMQKQMQEQAEVQEQLEQLETVAKRFMSPEAIARYGNMKAVHTEKAIQSIVVIAQLVQQNKITEKITDDQYKNVRWKEPTLSHCEKSGRKLLCIKEQRKQLLQQKHS